MLLQRSDLQRSAATLSPSVSAQSGEKVINEPAVAPARKLASTLEAMLRTPPHLRGSEVIEEVEHAMTKWSKYGLDMPRTVRLELCKYMGFASFGAGDTIFNQGETGEHFYIILSGAVAVSVYVDEETKEEKVVAHLLAGASFGELALMQAMLLHHEHIPTSSEGHGQRRATCRCSQKSELFVVDIKDFKRILQPLQQDTLQTKIAFLQQIPLFQRMSPAEIESLAVVVTEKAYLPKSVVFYQGNEVEDLFFIQRGHVKMVRETEMAAKSRPGSSVTPSARPSTAPASTIPAWLADEDTKPSSRACAAAQRNGGSTSSSNSRSRKSQGMHSDAATSPGYHKLSLELIKSMSGDKLNGKGPLDARATLRRPPASASSRRTLQPCSPATPVFQDTVRPGSGFHSGIATQRRPTGLKFAANADTTNQEKQQQKQAAAAKERNWLMSEQTLNKRVVQRLDFTKNLRAQKHLFLEVEYMNKGDCFGEVAVTKTPIAQTTAVASGMTTIVLVISKWDLVKRVPKEVLDFLADRAKISVLDDSAVRSQYVACQEWLRYRESIVADVVYQHKAKRLTSPIYIWQGGFRDQISCEDSAHCQVLWKPTGLAKNSPYTCY